VEQEDFTSLLLRQFIDFFYPVLQRHACHGLSYSLTYESSKTLCQTNKVNTSPHKTRMGLEGKGGGLEIIKCMFYQDCITTPCAHSK